MTKIEFDPTTQKVVDDFDAHVKKRASELLARTENAPLQVTREISFCLGYKAGVIDLGAAMREEAVVDVARMASVFAAACAWRDSSRVDRGFLAGTVDACEARLIDAVEAARAVKLHETQVLERTCNHCGHVDRHTAATETATCGKCGTEANPVQRMVPATEVIIEKGRLGMKAQNWTVSARYAAPGSRPGNRRHPSPEDFRRRTVVGPPTPATVEAVLDLLEVPEDMRVKIRAKDIVRNFVEGALAPDQPYPHHTVGFHYVSDAPDAQLVEWSIDFAFVTQVIDQGSGGPS